MSKGMFPFQVGDVITISAHGRGSPLVLDEETIIEAVTGKELLDPVWNYVFSTEKDKEAA